MRTLFHMPLDGASRAVRIALAEKGLPVQLVEAPPWVDNEALIRVNAANETPTLIDQHIDQKNLIASPAMVTLEYLETAYPVPELFPQDIRELNEARRISAWFLGVFSRDVSTPLVNERLYKKLRKHGAADYDVLRAALNAFDWHLDFFEWRLGQTTWLAGETYSVADVTGAGFISVIDYLDGVNWASAPAMRDWYARIKSRPAMRPILRDRVHDISPPRHYQDPDF